MDVVKKKNLKITSESSFSNGLVKEKKDEPFGI
ncbi:hypothetical protein BH18THE1_BH18THE1_18180 [soil metagenome]